MMCLSSKYFWDEAKCVVEPNSLDFKNLNSKLYTLSWQLVTDMICLFSKYFWDEAKCVVEPNSSDFKHLNSKLYALVFTVLKVGYKHDLLIFEIFLKWSKMCGRTKLRSDLFTVYKKVKYKAIVINT